MCLPPVEWLQIDDEEVKGFDKGADMRNNNQRSHTVCTLMLSHIHTHTTTFTHMQAEKKSCECWGWSDN